MLDDLRAVNDTVVPIHSLMINPHNILVHVPEDAKWFIMLKCSTPRMPSTAFQFTSHYLFTSQYLFAFEWANSHMGQMQQYTLTVLP